MKKLLMVILLFSACGKEVDKEVKVVNKFKTEAYTETYMMPKLLDLFQELSIFQKSII